MSITEQTSGQKIGKYVRYQREKRGWTVTHLSELTRFTPSFLMRLEEGKYLTVKFTVIERLAEGLEMPLRSFLWKCRLIEDETPAQLPAIEFYLKEKFQLPPRAIDDVKLLLALIHRKYKKEIAEMKSAHQQYWKRGKSHES